MRIEPAHDISQPSENHPAQNSLKSSTFVPLPDWNPVMFPDMSEVLPFSPRQIATPHGRITTYGPRPDGSEHFAVISHREKNPKPGIFQLRLCFLPTSRFAGPNPMGPHRNFLREKDRSWTYSAYDYRSTFFDLFPAKTPTSKGLLVYHTSIMLLSIAEKQVVQNFQKRGWNVMVAQPPDSLFRTKVPAQTSPAGSLENAARLLAEDMDAHVAEQAYSTRAALAYLRETRPEWLTKKKVLMGTSAGTFALPAEVSLIPDWDAVVFVSGGSNLLSLYESGSAGLFQDSLDWVEDARMNPPAEVSRVFSDKEYHWIFKRAASLTRLHAGALASTIKNRRVLMISGRLDRIMPRSQSETLYDALGRPERWTAALGHHLIAVQLIFEVDRLDRWLMKTP